MKIIYFDNSTLAMLERVLRADPNRFDRFLKTWHSVHFLPAVSTTHIQEICRATDATSRRVRYQILDQLGPLWTNIPVHGASVLDISSVTMREIYFAAMVLSGRFGPGKGQQPRWMGFPTLLRGNIESAISEFAEDATIRDLWGKEHSARSFEAAANRRAPTEKYSKVRLRQLLRGTITAEQMTDAVLTLEEWFEHGDEWKAATSGWTSGQLEEFKVATRQMLTQSMLELVEHGPGRVFLKFLGLDDATPTQAPVTDLIAQSLFHFQVVNCLSSFFEFPPSIPVGDFAADIRLECCPGTWLRHLISEEIKRGDPMYPVSNTYDLDHIMHLPYVDIFVTDKRVAHFVRLARAATSGSYLWTIARPPVALAAEIDALEGALMQPLPIW